MGNPLQFDAGRSNLVDLVRFRARYQPNDVAFTYVTNSGGVGASEKNLTYSELDRRCRRVAAWLQRNDMRGKRALLLYRPGLEFISGFYGCLYAGATAIPAYPPTKNRSMLRIQSIASDAEASMALTTTDVVDQVKNTINETPLLQQIPWVSTDALPEGIEDDWVDPEVDQSDIAFLQYTSGSTGTPKGVMLSHGNMLSNSTLIERGFEHTRSSVGVYWLPSYHDMGLIGGVIQPVFCGCRIYMMAPLNFLTRPHVWLQMISKYKATTSGGPNFAYDLCVKIKDESKLEGIDLSSWKVAFNGAEPVRAETLERFAAKFERYGFNYNSFYPCFGLAEGTLIVTGGMKNDPPIVRSIDADALGEGRAVEVQPDAPRAHKVVSSGRVIFGQRLAIVDEKTLKELPDGRVGEIWTCSSSVAQGYWHNPTETERVFQARLADKPDEGPFLRTGDLGFVQDGELFVTGRIKDMMIIRGVNVYPQDIEITAQGVSSSLVINGGGAFLVGGPDEERLVLLQEVERNLKDSGVIAELFSEIRKRVALEHETPISEIVFIQRGSLPKTSSGKVQRHACRDAFLKNELKVVARWSVDDVATSVGDVQKTSSGATGYSTEDNPLYVGDESASESAAAWKETEQDVSNVFTVSEKKNEDDKSDSGVSEGLTTLVPSAISYKETARIVLEEIRRVGKERVRDVMLDTDVTTLGLDSLERMEIIAAIEDRFGGQFPEESLQQMATVRELVDGVRKYLGVGRSVPAAPKRYEIDDACSDVSKFPEYIAIHQKFEMAKSLGMNHFFEPHEGAAGATIRINGKDYINFSTYNYIGTSGDPRVTAAAQDAVAQYGTTAGASRIVAGELPIHRELENEITKFLGVEDTIVLVGGHQTNESIIGHLMGAEDLILHDSLAHNSIVQGCILSGARRRPFPHGDWNAVDKILATQRTRYRRVLIVLEGVYSMDGDYPELPEFIKLREKYKTLLMIDEAHSIGVLGKTGRGIGEHFNVNRRDVDIWMCTLSKTFASCGGYIAGRKELVEYLKYTAPSFMFSVGMPPAQAGAALAALRVLEAEPERAEKLRSNSAYFKELARGYGMNVGLAADTGVVPVILGNSIKTLAASHQLFLRGINAHPILHPAVEEHQARIRFFLTSLHSSDQIKTTVDTLAIVLKELEAQK